MLLTRLRAALTLALLAFPLAGGTFPSPHALAQPTAGQQSTVAAVQRLFREAPQAEWFGEAFLDQVSLDEITALIAGLKEKFGPLRSVSGEGRRLIASLERADVAIDIALDANGRISTLFLKPAIPAGDVADHVAAIAALPGETSVLVTRNGEVLAAHAPEQPLAVGSAAKLAILKALDEAVATGRLNWDDVAPLDDEWRSLPTGILQDWPPATPITLAALANLMISISDNTATDALIDIVGREAVEAVSPRNRPFLTTAEMFKLKGADEDVKNAWLDGGVEERRAMLASLDDKPLPSPEAMRTPSWSIEWFMSASEICDLLEAVADLPAMRINSGLAEPAEWRSVAFKGGSETGVVNFSTRLVDNRGAVHCVVATWNGDAEVTAESLSAPYRGILSALGAVPSD